MTQAISHFSRHDDAGVALRDGKYIYSGRQALTAEVKIAKFYRYSILSLVALAVILFLATSDLKILKSLRAPG